MEDNKHYHYSEKEVEQFTDMWNQGVPTHIMAEHFRRSPQSISNQANSLRRRGYDLKADERRKEATRLYKKANQPKGTYADQYEYLAEEGGEPDVITVEPTESTDTGMTDRFYEWREMQDDCAEEMDEPEAPHQTKQPASSDSRMEVLTIVTIDGREVSRSTSTTYL